MYLLFHVIPPSSKIVGKEFDLDGAVFSVGETQKLAIARAIAKNTEIVILDEPSSALDPHYIQHSRLWAHKNATII